MFDKRLDTLELTIKWYQATNWGSFTPEKLFELAVLHYYTNLRNNLESLIELTDSELLKLPTWREEHERLNIMANGRKWICKCGEINTSLEWDHEVPSELCNNHGNVRFDHSLIKWISADTKTADEKRDLFDKFYNSEAISIANMTHEDFVLHEQELALIAFEAKARLTAIIDKKRDDINKRTSNQNQWIIPRSDAEEALVSDAIAAVGKRKKRMNKIEKLKEQLQDSGLDDATVEELIRNVERKATDNAVNLTTFVSSKERETKKAIAEVKKSDEPKIVEDFSNLKFSNE